MLTDVLVGVVILVGLVGVVVPFLPGAALILGAVLVWAVQTGTGVGWAVFAAVTTLLAAGTIVKYAVPGRRLQLAGIPNRTLLVGGVLGVAGFLVIPVVGLLVGFVLGVYAAEVGRVGSEQAWPSTKHALRAVGLSVLIELGAALLASLTWLVAAVAT